MDQAQPTKQELIESRINKDVAGLMPVTSLGLAFNYMLEIMEFAKMMAVSDAAVPPVFRNNPGACLAVAMQAHALGFEPFAFARKCYFVNDQIAYESQLIHAIIVRKAGFVKRPSIAYVGEGQDRQCVVTLHMAEPDGDVVYTSPKLKDIKPQNSPLWKTDPDQQQAYYSVRASARRYVPDVIMGMYDPEEMAAAAKDITPPRPIEKPRADVAAALSGGSKLEVVTPGEKAAETAAPSNDAAKVIVPEESAPAAPPAADPAKGADSPAASEAAPSATATPDEKAAAGDIFDQGLIAELTTSLAGVTTLEALKALEDDFAEALGHAGEDAREEAAKLFAAHPAAAKAA